MSVAAIESHEPEAPAAAAPLNRMVIAVLALIGVVIAGYMFLYKVGIIDAIACGTGSCGRVQASPWADLLGVPVPLIGIGGYGAVFALSLLGVQPERAEDRRIAVGLLALTGGAVAFSAYLSIIEAFWIRAWCRWCVASAAVATLAFLCALPELRRLRRPR